MPAAVQLPTAPRFAIGGAVDSSSCYIRDLQPRHRFAPRIAWAHCSQRYAFRAARMLTDTDRNVEEVAHLAEKRAKAAARIRGLRRAFLLAWGCRIELADLHERCRFHLIGTR